MVFKRAAMLFLGCFGFACDKAKPIPTSAESAESSSTSPSASSEDFNLSDGTLRIRLSDGRYLAYQERGVPKHQSKYKVVIVHGFGSSKDMSFMASQDIMDELGVYLLLYDRAGYGESDPNPKRSVKSEASDIQELADQLQLGSKFYVIGVSLGSYPTWSCLKRIPHRLAGVALVVPMINYNWPSLPRHLTKDDYRKNLSRWTLWVTRYAPGLLHWWLTQKIFPSSSVLDRNPTFFSNKDLEVLKNTPGYQLLSKNKLGQQGVFDSLRRDFIVAFSKWDFDPLEISDPFLISESSVHIWQGYEDKVVPFPLQRHVWSKLPWIKYHEVPDGGHLLVYDSAVCEAILRSLLLGEDPPLYRPKLVDKLLIN
ncbi:Triacylglycerol lipase [Bertholletia excelsa]